MKKDLRIAPENVVMDNPYFQRGTQKQRGCQIDYMIQTKYNSLYLCEIKFSKERIGLEVIEEMKEKMENLSAPRKFSLWPVLIHVNGVTESLAKSGFFSKIIDFGDLL